MKGQILSADGGILSEFYYDDTTDRAVIRTCQDVEPYLKANKAAFNDAPTRWGEFAHVASIPVVVLEKWGNEDGINYLAPENSAALRAKLNDPDNKFLRTRPGRI